MMDQVRNSLYNTVQDEIRTRDTLIRSHQWSYRRGYYTRRRLRRSAIPDNGPQEPSETPEHPQKAKRNKKRAVDQNRLVTIEMGSRG